MAIPFAQSIDLNLLEILNATAQNLPSAPSHKAGRFYFDTALQKLGISTGTAWVYLGEVGPLDVEGIQDIVGDMFSTSTNVTATYDDATGKITLTVADGVITNAMVSATAAIALDKIAETTGLKILTAAERTKLTGIATGATANATDAQLRDRATHTGSQSADTVVDGTANKVYTAAEKTKLTGIAAGATANSSDATLLARANHTGTQSVDTLTDGTANKLFTAAKDTKLTGIATGATANSTDAALRDRATHTGTQSADTVIDGTTNKAFTAANQTKLAGIAAGATVNATDAALRDRSTHTGTQPSSTISDFTTAVDARVANVIDAAPGTLDTLNELAAALGDDPNFATTITNQLALKANIADLAPVATAGTYASLTGKPIFTATIGNGSATSFVVTHNLNTRNVIVDVSEAAGSYRQVWTEVQKTSVNTITVVFATAPTTSQYVVTVQA